MKIKIFILLIYFSSIIYSQVRISPTVVFIDEPRRSYPVKIENITDNDVEIWFNVEYSYIASDDSNNLIVVKPKSYAIDDKSAAEWVSFYPEKIVLTSFEKRTVRVIIKPPMNLNEGEYWCRIIVNSKLITKTQLNIKQGNATIGFDITNQFSIPLHYRKGKMFTNIEMIGNPIINVENDKLQYLPHFRNVGNGAYWGLLNFEILNDKGRILKKEWKHFVVYKEIKHLFRIGIKDLPSGNYTLRVKAETKRYDDAAKYVIQTEPKIWKYNFRIQ